MPDPLLAFTAGDLIHRAAAGDRKRRFVQNILAAAAARFAVLGFDQKPVVVLLAGAPTHADEMPAAMQLFAFEREFEMALGIAFVRIAFRDPTAAVPDHDRAAAIFAVGNSALKRIVVDRM